MGMLILNLDTSESKLKENGVRHRKRTGINILISIAHGIDKCESEVIKLKMKMK